MTGILNLFLEAVIQFHNNLYLLHTGRVTREVYLESKILPKLTSIREEFLFEIFYIFINPMTSHIRGAKLESLWCTVFPLGRFY